MNELDYLWDIYMAAKRSHYKIAYVKRGKQDKDEDMQKVLDITKELRCDPGEYMEFQIKRISPTRVFPTAAHMGTDKAKQAYQLHMGKKGIYNTDLYYVKDKEFTVKKTKRVYPISEVEAREDPSVKWVTFLSDHPNMKLCPADMDNVLYVEAKFHFMMVQPTDRMSELFDKVNSIIQGEK